MEKRVNVGLTEIPSESIHSHRRFGRSLTRPSLPSVFPVVPCSCRAAVLIEEIPALVAALEFLLNKPQVLAENLPELRDFPKDLVSLEASTKIQLQFLAEEMQATTKGLEKVVQELTASENDGEVLGNFCKVIPRH
ncbi:hypothetical protein WN944_024114 [Citrus x changshan-huyou]|uniref:FH2 domain-containing protein n=1 Tax=Citrus x changshan-huyou TaxID=2935761 RepID=A0AAP0LMW9_9ROSI